MNLSEYAAQHGLQRVGARPALLAYAKQVWQRRAFALTLARSRIGAKNRANRLGLAWLVISPILDALIYGIVFGVLQGDKRPENYIQFLVIGIFFFRFFSQCLSSGAKAVTGNKSLVQSLSFPRIMLPLATAIEQFINFIPMIVLMLIVNIAYVGWPALSWLYLIPIIAMLSLFNTGLVMFVARLTVHLRDITQIVPLVNRIMRYFSGVFYDPAVYVGGMPLLMGLFVFNPLYDYMEMARAALIPGYAIDSLLIWSGLAWSIGGFLLASIFFWSAEEQYGRLD